MKLESNPTLGFELSRQKDYWQRTLGDELPVLHLCSDYPRPPVCSFIRASETIDLASDICGEIRSLCARQNVTVFVMLLAAFKALLFRHSGLEDVIVGSVSSDSIIRTEEGEEPFTNPVALRTSLAGDLTFARLLKRVAETVEAASANRDWPFERILDDIHQESRFG
ncbi:MAG TPA: condensation domain-containing protein, partial [Candidatus Binatia bacterium]